MTLPRLYKLLTERGFDKKAGINRGGLDDSVIFSRLKQMRVVIWLNQTKDTEFTKEKQRLKSIDAAVNELEKIRPAIKSRCTIYNFTPINADDGAGRLWDILQGRLIKSKRL